MKTRFVLVVLGVMLCLAGISYYYYIGLPTFGFLPLSRHGPVKTDSAGRYLPNTTVHKDHCTMAQGLPDQSCTPGAVNHAVTQGNIQTTICVKGYTKKIRPPLSYTNKLKREQMLAYGFTGSLSNYEEDHQIPLEVGGDPVNPANLWPEPHEPFPGSFDKDHVENYLHKQVCNGSLSLARAQELIATDWVGVYHAVGPSIVNY